MTGYINFGVGINMCFPLVFLMPATFKMPESMGTLKSHIKTSWVSYQLNTSFRESYKFKSSIQ